MTDRIQQAFEEFHEANPHVYRTMESLATEWFQNHRVVGVKMLWEALRWRLGLQTFTDDDFRLNNNYTSRYARLLIAQHPEWAGRIHLRQLVSAGAEGPEE